MNLIYEGLEFLKQRSIFELFFLFLIENALLIIIAIGFGYLLDGTIGKLSVKISRKEILWTCSTLFLNTVVTLIGFLLYKNGIVRMPLEAGFLKIVLDTFVLLLGMDFLMFVFHYMIHNIKFMKTIHDLHHEYENPTPITLFVLNPLEVFGFGSLWIGLIILYPASLIAVSVYLFLNIVMGTIGHLEIEVIPASWSDKFLLKWIANTTFHNDHHKLHNRNYGFYTNVWDKIFGTGKEGGKE